MRYSLVLRMLLRSPIRTLLIFILLGLVSFAFFSQAAEYAITVRELNKAAAAYQGTGSVEVSPPYTPREAGTGYPYHLSFTDTATGAYKLLTQEQIDAVSNLRYISSTDARYMTAGVSNRYYRMDDGDYFYNFSARCVVEATVFRDKTSEGYTAVMFPVVNSRVLAGYVPKIGISETIQTNNEYNMTMLHGLEKNILGPNDHTASTITGSNRMWVIQFGVHNYGQDQLRSLTTGSRYVFVLRFSLFGLHGTYYYFIGDYLSDAWCEAVWPLDGEPENYLELEKYAPLRELIKITKADSHTFDVVYTEDMSSIMRFADGRMAIKEGRALTAEDSEAGSAVCAVDYLLAAKYRLKVGDRIKLGLGDRLFEQYLSLGAVASTPARYSPPVTEAELEIVGIYANTDGPGERSNEPHWGYSVNTIFVPRSLLPAEEASLEGHEFAPGEFSFVVGDARDIGAFLNEEAPKIEAMGLRLIFDDGGWLDIESGFAEAGRLSLVKIAASAAAMAAAAALSAYLFIWRRRGDYAAMRALGTERGSAGRALVLPLAAVAAAAALIGVCAAALFVSRTIAGNGALAALGFHEESVSIPIGLAAICAVGQLAATLAVAAGIVLRMGNQSPLALLQRVALSNDKRRGAAKNLLAVEYGHDDVDNGSFIADAEMHEEQKPSGQTSEAQMLDKKNYENRINRNGERRQGSAGARRTPRVQRVSRAPSAPRLFSRTVFTISHISKHIRRTGVKSGLAVILALLLSITIGRLSAVNESYKYLVSNTKIKANFIGGMDLSAIKRISDSAYASSKYYEGLSKLVDVGGATTTIVVTNDIMRHSGKEVNIAYADGYDSSCFDDLGEVLILGRSFADQNDMEPGDMVNVAPSGLYANAVDAFIGLHRLSYPEDEASDEELFDYYFDDIASYVESLTCEYTVAGIVEPIADEYLNTVYAPGLASTPNLFGPVEAAEFTLADGQNAEEFRSYCEIVIGNGVTMFMDTSKVENLKNSQKIIELLYPMAIAAALLIGGFMCCLVILQSSKEAAIMRILGATKAGARASLVSEQAVLSVVGLAAGLGGMGVFCWLKQEALPSESLQFSVLYLVAVLVCSTVCSAIATHRPPLELLQVRE